MSLRRTSIKQHAAGGQIVTGTTSVVGNVDTTSQMSAVDLTITNASSFGGEVNVASVATIKTIKVNSTLGGTATVLSGTASITVSLTNINSNSLIMLQSTTDVASDQILNISPTSRIDGSSFGVVVEDGTTTTRDMSVNYLIFEV